MTAWRPISPTEARNILENATVGGDAGALLIDLAQAGLVKGYARLIERAGGDEVRDSRIDRDLWRQVVEGGKAPEIFSNGTVRLEGASAIGIRFDERSVRVAATEHGCRVEPARQEAVASKKAQPAAAKKAAASVEAAPEVAVERSSSSRPSFTIPAGTLVLNTLEAASALRVGKTTLVALANSGKIERRSVGRRTVYTVESIKAFLQV